MSWIRSIEFKNIKENLREYSVKQTAVYFDRAIGTIYNVNKSKNHEEYCKNHNFRQWEAEYSTTAYKNFVYNKTYYKTVDYDDSGIVGEVKKLTQEIILMQESSDWTIKRLVEKLNELSKAVNELRGIK